MIGFEYVELTMQIVGVFSIIQHTTVFTPTHGYIQLLIFFQIITYVNIQLMNLVYNFYENI
jgi:hypothetical protein